MSEVRTIQQATIVEPKRIEVVETLLPPAASGYAAIEVESCGICGSDLTMYRGAHPVIKPPIVFGHEVIGTLSEIDPAQPDFKVGDRVAFLPQVGCDECSACRRGDHRLCRSMRLIGGQIPGGMATAVIVPIENLIHVPDSIPAPLRVLAEPLAVGVHAAGRTTVCEETNCLVMGAGPIGLLLALVLRHRGARDVFLLDLDPRRVDIARSFGFRSDVTAPSEEFDAVFDCVGGAGAARSALETVRAAGAVVLVGVASPELMFSGILLQRQERTVTGSHMYTRAEFKEALDLLGNGLIPADDRGLSLLFRRGGIADVADMLASLDDRSADAIKIVVDFR